MPNMGQGSSNAGKHWGHVRLVGSESRSRSQIRWILPESTEHFILGLGCCHVDEVINWRSLVTQKGESRTHHARRTKSQQDASRTTCVRTTMCTKMTITHHIRTKVTFGSVGSGQPCSPRWIDRIQIQRIQIRIRPIERVRIQWIRIPIRPIEHALRHVPNVPF